MSSKKIKVNNVSYVYSEFGEGETVLLLHGFTGTKETWSSLIDHLAKDFHVLAIDILGHGETDSPGNSERYHMEQVAKDINDFLNEKQIESVHLLGYSMGGRLALYFALNYQHKVKTLLLESCTAGLESVDERLSRIKLDDNLAHMIMDKGIQAFVDYWEEIPLFSTQKNLPISVQENIRNRRLEQSQVGLSNSLKGMGTGVQPSLWQLLKELTIPTLLVCGEYDEKFCLIMGKMKEMIKNSEFIKIPNVGHAIHVEQSEKFATIVDGFLLEKGRFKNDN